jgi:hypothetical protein
VNPVKDEKSEEITESESVKVPEEQQATPEENEKPAEVPQAPPQIINQQPAPAQLNPPQLNPNARPFRPQQKFNPRAGPQNQQHPQRWMPPQMRPMRPMMGRPQMRGNFPPRPYFQRNPGGGQIPPGPGQPRFGFFPQNGPPRPILTAPNPNQPTYIPSPIVAQPAMPRKVLINPNFKGGVEAAKSERKNLEIFNKLTYKNSFLDQLLKDHFSTQSQSMLSEDELLRKQQEFINRNIRSIEKRRHDQRSPSPNYRRSYSHSPSPPRNFRRRPMRNYERRRSTGDNKQKDENLPEEDEETRAYRLKIETQRKQREELLRQKEMRRKQQMEQKVKEKEPSEPLKPIVVTEKKIILTKKARLDEKSTTPPLLDEAISASLVSNRKITLKSAPATSSKGSDVKIGIAGNEKRKLQKFIAAEN